MIVVNIATTTLPSNDTNAKNTLVQKNVQCIYHATLRMHVSHHTDYDLTLMQDEERAVQQLGD